MGQRAEANHQMAEPVLAPIETFFKGCVSCNVVQYCLHMIICVLNMLMACFIFMAGLDVPRTLQSLVTGTLSPLGPKVS
jgi:hypothetical protein